MPEYLHPGVYVEERRSGLAPIQGVSTSNMGIVGFTPNGPSNEAVLVTSYTQFKDTFGDFTSDSQVPTHVYAFFANGGRRAYVVRVTGSGSAASAGYLQSDWAEEAIATPDGVALIFTSAAPTPGIDEVNLSHIPTLPGSCVLTWYEAGVPVVAEASDCNPTPNGALLSFAGKLGTAAGNPDKPIVPGSVTINVIAAPKTYVDVNADGVLVDSAAPLVPLGRIDYQTGHFSITMVAAPVNAADVTYDYTPRGAARTAVSDTTVPVGAFSGTGVVAGTINWTTGVWTLTVAAAPANLIPIQAAYTQRVWAVTAISDGEWGDDVRVDVRGDEDYFARATAYYSRHDVLVYKLNEDGDYDLKETFDSVSFTDPADSRYVAALMNNEGVGSDYVDLTEPSNEDVAPRSLSGYSRRRAVGAGNGTQDEFGSSGATPTIPNPFVTDPLEIPVQPGSVSIAYIDTTGAARSITDDGSGNLIGDIDPAAAVGFNTIDYDTGEFAFATGDGAVAVAIGTYVQAGVGCLPIIIYYKQPVETTQQDSLSGGNDGAALTRAELTSPALSADREGMYALLTTDELINLTIPDAAGSVIMANDEVTEAERNEKWFVILASPPGYNKQQVKDWRINTLGITSSYAALYWPYITITDPVTDLPTNIPPGGHIAGVYARTDNAKSVGKAPAGTEDGRLLFATGIETRVEWADIDILHPNQINTIVNTPQTGLCVWGCRTLERPPGDFRYIHVRRLFNFLKASIFNSTHAFVFESVGPPLWSRIRMSVESFLLTLFQQGLFAGGTPSDAYLVICDETNNPKAVQDQGFVITDIYVAPNTPGEFIVFRIQQKVAQAA